VALAVSAFAFSVYRIWAYERRQLVELEAHLAPRLRIEFDPLQLKFVSSTPVVGSLEMLYVRVLARAVSPVVKDCRAYLNFSSSLMVERQRCRFRRNIHHLPIHPLHHPSGSSSRVFLHPDRSPQPSSACRALAVAPPAPRA
jgi:hypothetical protein